MDESRRKNAEELRRLRLRAGLSQRQLAAQAGISQPSIGRAENGGSLARPALWALANVLGPEVYDLVPAYPAIEAGDVPVLAARRASGLSRRQAARQIGIKVGVLMRAEQGQHVHPMNAKAIAEAYGLDVIALFPARQDEDRESAVA